MNRNIRRAVDTMIISTSAVLCITVFSITLVSPILESSTSVLIIILSVGLITTAFLFKTAKKTIQKVNAEDKLRKKEKEQESKRTEGLGAIERMTEEGRVAQEKSWDVEWRKSMVFEYLSIPAFVGIWISSGFAWGPLIGLTIGWLPAFIGGLLLYLLFQEKS